MKYSSIEEKYIEDKIGILAEMQGDRLMEDKEKDREKYAGAVVFRIIFSKYKNLSPSIQLIHLQVLNEIFNFSSQMPFLRKTFELRKNHYFCEMEKKSWWNFSKEEFIKIG
jgi:hypothetical protein